MAGGPKVTFELLFCVFEFSGVWGSAGEMAGNKASGRASWLTVAETYDRDMFNKLKTTPTHNKNKNGSYGMKRGGLVCHLFGSVRHIFSVEIP